MKFRSRLIALLTFLMIFQSMLFGGAALAAGSNLPNVTEYGLYNYENANNSTAPSPIGSILTTGNSGSSYTEPPWTTLTDVPYDFPENVGIGIKFAVNVATPTYWEQNSIAMCIYSPASGIIDSDIIRLGDGTNTDVNRNYIFVIPKESLQPASTYKILIDGAITGNNGNQAGKAQEVEFTTTGAAAADTTPPTWAVDSTLTASDISSTSLTLTWSLTAEDDVGVTGYKILQDGSEIGTVSGAGTLSYEVSGLSVETPYSFQVLACDNVGNWSTDGPTASATTSAADDTTNVSLALNKNSVVAGGSVTASGTAGPNRWVSIAGLSSSQDIVLFDAAKSNDSGSYSCTFNVPSGSPGTLTILAGYGSNVASASLAGILEITSDITVSDDGSNKDMAITTNTPNIVSVTIPQGVSNATINVSVLLSDNGAGGLSSTNLPALNISANTSLSSNPVEVAIPAGTTVSGDASWDGTINVPTVKANNSVTVPAETGKTATVNTVIEVGFGDVPLTFDKPVRILIPGQAGKEVGYSRGGSFTKISNVLTQDSGDALGSNPDGRIDVGSDLVIWTNHFTSFVTYTQSSSDGGSGGSTSDSQAPTWPTGSTLTGSKSGQVVSLNWTAATDNVAVTGYNILVDGSAIDQVDGSTLTYSTSSVSGPHTFKIEAGDAAGNWSTDGPEKYVSGGGDNPLNYISSNLTTISGSTSSEGDAVDGSASVPASTTIRIVFDRNVTSDAIWDANQQCFSMNDSSGASVEINVSKISNTVNFDERQHVFITPVGRLTAGKTYTITISKSLEANNGNTLGSDQTITFTVAGGSDSSTITTSGPTVTSGSATVDPALGATVGQGDDAIVVIPANALKGSSLATVKVQKVDSPPAAPADAKAISDAYEFSVDNNKTYSFNNKVAITLSFDASLMIAGEQASLFYYDASKSQWVNLGGEVSGNGITVQVDQLNMYGVFAVMKNPVTVPQTNVKAPSSAAVFSDISGHWAEGNINKLLARGVVSGYSDGSFRPNDLVGRAEFVTMLVKAFNLEPRSGQVFADTEEHWARESIATAAAHGIVSGLADNRFAPDDPITREQMIVMVVKAAKLPAISEEIAYSDAGDISTWAREAMSTAIKNGIIKGYDDNTIKPWRYSSRAEAVTIIINALE